MKKLMRSIALLPVLLLCSFTGHDTDENLKTMNLEGNVKAISQVVECAPQFQAATPALRARECEWKLDYRFDENGNCTEIISTRAGKSARTVYTYDPNGNQTSRIMYTLDGRIFSKLEHQYNDDNLLVAESFYLNPQMRAGDTIYTDMDSLDRRGMSTYKYDKRGRVIEENIFSADSSLHKRSVTKYDRQGYTTQTEEVKSGAAPLFKKIDRFDAQGNILQEAGFWNNDKRKSVTKYDAQHRPAETDNFDSTGNYAGKYVYEYTGDTIIKRETYLTDGQLAGTRISHVNTIYDYNGNLIEKNETTQSENGEIKKQSHLWQYDSHSNPVQESSYLNGYTEWESPVNKYTYDDYGNWMERKTLGKNDTLLQFTKRDISYY